MQDTVIVGEVQPGEATKVRKSLEKSLKQINLSMFDLIDLLWTVKSKHLYTTVSFNDYLKTLDFKLRRLQYLSRIGEVMAALNIPRAEFEPLGVAKLHAITRLEPTATYTNPVTKETHPMSDYINGLLEVAPDKTVKELEETVRVLKGETGDNDLTWLNLRMPRLVMDNVVQPAFAKAAANLGSTKTDADGVAEPPKDWQKLEVICLNYTQSKDTDPEVS